MKKKSKTPIRIAIIGLGHIGMIHLSALSAVQGFKVVALCDKDRDLIDKKPESALWFDEHKTMLEFGGFDSVIIATPNTTHGAIACDALEAGFDIILEKPAGVNIAELERIESLAKKKKCDVYFAFHASAAYEVTYLIDKLDDVKKNYGPITAFHCQFFDPYLDQNGDVLEQAYGLGGCWIDSGINALSVLDKLMAIEKFIPKTKMQALSSRKNEIAISSSFSFNYPVSEWKEGGFGVIDTAWNQGKNFKTTSLYFGEVGNRVVIDHSNQTVFNSAENDFGEGYAAFKGDRLFNHYVNIFNDYRRHRLEGLSENFSQARRIHNMFFATLELI